MNNEHLKPFRLNGNFEKIAMTAEEQFKRACRATFGACTFVRRVRGFKVITEVRDTSADVRFAAVCNMLTDYFLEGAVTDCFDGDTFVVRNLEISPKV